MNRDFSEDSWQPIKIYIGLILISEKADDILYKEKENYFNALLCMNENNEYYVMITAIIML